MRRSIRTLMPRALCVMLAAAATLLLVACASDAPNSDASTAKTASRVPALRVVTTTDILADWVAHVGGDRVEVLGLLPSGTDPHSYQPGARDITSLAQADLVFSVGLGLEAGWLRELVENATASPSTVVALGEVVGPILATGEHADSEGAADKSGHNGVAASIDEAYQDQGIADPHFWFDPARVKSAVSHVASRLSVLDPDGADTYRANAQVYSGRLDELDEWIQQRVATVPAERRLLLTSHDSLQYFASRYGFSVIGAVIPGVTTEIEPSAEDIARLVGDMRGRGVRDVFTEAGVSDRFAQTVAKETGASIVRDLFTGSLGRAGSGAETYLDMMRFNVRTIVEALR